MKNRFYHRALYFISALVLLVSCKDSETVDPVLAVSETQITIVAEGGEATITVDCNDAWTVNNSAAWLQVDQTSGSSGSATITISTALNATGASRSVILHISSSNGQSRRVKVIQAAFLYPIYNLTPKEPDASGMGSTAMELAAKMKLGWNIGNTMEAPGGETGWGNPAITEDYVKFVKQQGFNAIRIPCAWDWNWDKNYFGDNYHIEDRAKARIKAEWLDRVKEVVGYCVNNDMYVLLNIHWDGGWLENNCTPEKKDSVNAKQKAYWEQIATAMRDFDEHLMFASANEPNAGNATQMEVLLSYHQTFVNAVRSTGGRNTYRSLVIQGSHQYLNVSMFPTDPTPNRLMYEEHNYTPSQFTFLGEDVSWGNMVYYWGEGHHSTIEPDRNPTYGEEDAHIEFFQKMKKDFIDKGIPVLMGEYGAYRRNNSAHVPLDLETHEASVDYWTTFVTKQAIAHGVIPFWWDTGGALDRRNYTVKDQRTIDAIIAGAN
ncbi:cellulase family glycosylhydrolase [Gaoshiqia sp. Z1-71]|uniref:cellulase family glycosylhydrolase n=1 Tax=Gaoshiqia hydrogeniformans TaxID=3290090 RepID=UPI003BF77F4E